MKGAEKFGQHLDSGEISAADGYRPFHRFLLLRELPLGLVHKLENFLRPAAQQKPFAGQGDLPRAPVKQPDPHFILHLGDLAAESGLGEVQQFSGPRNIFLPRHRQKVAQNPDFHYHTSKHATILAHLCRKSNAPVFWPAGALILCTLSDCFHNCRK